MQGYHEKNPVFSGLSPGDALSHNTNKETIPQIKMPVCMVRNYGRIFTKILLGHYIYFCFTRERINGLSSIEVYRPIF